MFSCLCLVSASIAVTLSVLPVLCLYFKLRRYRQRTNRKTVAFFHPYCSAGGGGERVLWLALKTLQEKYPDHDYYVYTGDTNIDEATMSATIERTFKIKLKKPPQCLFLKKRFLLEASMYPVFTLIGQSLGSMIVALEAMCTLLPDIYIDSMGYSFTFPVFKYLGGCKVACYVHYPTISTDMLQSVSTFNVGVNNRPVIARSKLLTSAKILYYIIFAKLYGLVGSVADVIIVNSSWTRNHILQLWKSASKTFLVFPPCNVDAFKTVYHEKSDQNLIISLSQFRPEKNHSLQLQTFQLFLASCPDDKKQKSRLVIIGSCRSEDDRRRVETLKKEASELKIQDQVDFKIGLSFDELLSTLKCGAVGLHTMKEEHFGIGIVELMAAGLVMLAHNSGGPKLDIIKNGVTGFLATSAEEYAEALQTITELNDEEKIEIRRNALKDIERFSDENFQKAFHNAIDSVFV